jgi:hypothetical protein
VVLVASYTLPNDDLGVVPDSPHIEISTEFCFEISSEISRGIFRSAYLTLLGREQFGCQYCRAISEMPDCQRNW